MWEDVDMIHTYTRAQAIADGVLIEVTDLVRKHEIPFKVPVAIARGIACDLDLIDDDGVLDEDRAVRLLKAAAIEAARTARERPSNSLLTFEVRRHPGAPVVKVYVSIDGGDHGEPVLTIMGRMDL